MAMYERHQWTGAEAVLMMTMEVERSSSTSCVTLAYTDSDVVDQRGRHKTLC